MPDLQDLRTAASGTAARSPRSVRLFLCGDVMTGRGIDQVLAHPCEPTLHEDFVASAKDYVSLAEQANGPIPRHLDASYVWGAALDELDRMRPDARIVNLETAITDSDDYVRKGINYRMSPENAGCLCAAGIDCCALANNHLLDWGRRGLLQTLATLQRLQIKTAGAGRNVSEAAAPAALDIANKARLLVFSFGSVTSGIPRNWAATKNHPGINLLPGFPRRRRCASRNTSSASSNRTIWSLFRFTGDRTGATRSPPNNGTSRARSSTGRMCLSFTAIRRITRGPSRSTMSG